MASYLQTELISHARKVCSLYKRALKNLQSYHHDVHNYRYEAVLMRQRFDENKNIKDVRQAKALYLAGEEELFNNMHVMPLNKFPNCPGGIAYNREVDPPDWVLDYWHPLEKAQYPEYFARRELRKKEYIEMWEKQYGKPQLDEERH